MNAVPQVLTALCWIVIAFAISPVVWLLFQPYFRGWSRAERRAADLLRDADVVVLHKLIRTAYKILVLVA